ncbi:glycosyltransferase family 61 protein [Sphingomonas piscis]|uniref:Glycosyltransferase family 61 protein n=1 Tax=Sphingomonas piscis TaxID=2714943 RepID=A0A6G7YMU3_9SPHN|nr:glycosyltransferase 61 family protein [Sphingomonas piscis]QIK78060.1 glycosyltransferase family 61 protein [Sphingomonas piscis]
MGHQFFYGFETGEAEERLRKVVTEPDSARPPIHHLVDAIALPGMPELYDTTGLRIDEAAVRTLSADAPPIRRQKLHRSENQVSVPARLKVVEEPVLFCGHLMKHYGHFVIESMSRLWARDLHTDLPVLFTRPGKWREPPSYGTDVLAALGVEARMMAVDEPTIFRQVVCPGTAFEYRWKAFTVADEPHLTVAKNLAGSPTTDWRRPVYLTRSGLPGDLRKSKEEPELEAELLQRGFDIVRPETLSLAEQISLFDNAPLVVGTVGSAMHTALFSRSANRKLAILNWGRGFENCLLVDSVKEHDSYYLKSMQRRGDTGEHVLDVARTLQLLTEAGLVDRKTYVGSA